MPTQPNVTIGLISAGSPKILSGEGGEDSPAYVTIDGRPIISHVLEQALASRLEQIYVWTRPDRIDRCLAIVDELPGKEKVRAVVASKETMFSSLTGTIREHVARDLFGRGDLATWPELLQYSDDVPGAKDTAVIHISSDSPLLSARELDRFCDGFDPAATDYSIGVTRREHVYAVLERHGLLDEFNALPSTIKNFTRIVDNSTGAPISIRINNLHIFKPFMLLAEQYALFERIFEQRKVSSIARWIQLAGLIRSIFRLPWLKDEEAKRDLYRTAWHLVRSQERLPRLLRKEPSHHTRVVNVERNIGFLMGMRARIYLDGGFGSFFDADAQEEYDFLRAHFKELAADPDL